MKKKEGRITYYQKVLELKYGMKIEYVLSKSLREFHSLNAAALAMNIPLTTFARWCKELKIKE